MCETAITSFTSICAKIRAVCDYDKQRHSQAGKICDEQVMNDGRRSLVKITISKKRWPEVITEQLS